MTWALVSPSGEILRTRETDDNPAPTLAPNKGRWLPVVREPDPAHDPVCQRLMRTLAVNNDTVTEMQTVEPLSATEINTAIDEQIQALEAVQARALREHVLGDPAALARLKTIDGKITDLRVLRR